jgi:hypothetical protein
MIKGLRLRLSGSAESLYGVGSIKKERWLVARLLY